MGTRTKHKMQPSRNTSTGGTPRGASGSRTNPSKAQPSRNTSTGKGAPSPSRETPTRPNTRGVVR